MTEHRERRRSTADELGRRRIRHELHGVSDWLWEIGAQIRVVDPGLVEPWQKVVQRLNELSARLEEPRR